MGVKINILILTWKLNCKCSLSCGVFTFCMLAPLLHCQEKLFWKSSSLCMSVHCLCTCSTALSWVVQSDWPLYTVIYGSGLAPHYKRWRKRAQCFTLINECDLVAELLKAKHTQPICLYICVCLVYPGWPLSLFRFYHPVKLSINHFINQIRLLQISCQ